MEQPAVLLFFEFVGKIKQKSLPLNEIKWKVKTAFEYSQTNIIIKS